MEIVEIGIEKLRPHPANANVMQPELMKKLKGHIARHGNYEPLVVRRDPNDANCFQLINGHHRKLVLEELGHTAANCVVWDLDDEETLILLATVNRLSGKDDVLKRATLLEKLSAKYSTEQLSKMLPERNEHLQKMLAITRPVEIIASENKPALPVSVSFFMSSKQKQTLEQALRIMKKSTASDDVDGKLTRGDLLAVMAGEIIKMKNGGGN